MSKLFQAFLSGLFFTYFIDFFLFLGIKINYIDFYEIDLYYNILFADNQNIYLFLLSTFIIGYFVIYNNSTKLKVSFIGILFFLSTLTLVSPIGHKVGELLFMKKNITLKESKHIFIGNQYYNGRNEIYFYDYELQKIIILNKKELK